MKKRKLLLLISTILFGCFFSSCQHEVFLPNPNIDTEDESDKVEDSGLHAPLSLISSQGKKRLVTLSWEPVKEADRYYIYESDSEIGTFKQVGETIENETNYEFDGASNS